MSGKKLLFSLIASSVLLLSANAFATLTYTQSAGLSAIDLTTVTAPIIYGGFTGVCTPDSTSNTCDSCTGTGLFPCNHNNITSATVLSLVFTTDNTTTTTAPVVKMTSSSGVSLGTTNWTVGATTFTVSILWSDICNNAPSNNTSDCTQDINAELYVGVGSDTMTLKLITRYQAGTAAANYVDCPAGTTDPNTVNVGFCHFSTFPGDSKIYADDTAVSTNFPTTPNSAVNYTSAVFFYEEQLSTDASDAATIARITNASPSVELAVSTTGTDLADDRVDGLTNGVRYCMVMASKDATGVISYFTPSTVAATTLCATPEPVVGLLDDKHCFIATAAFGSDMAPEVQSFRDFRNKFLLPYTWGQKFVKNYYKYSPKYANMIAGNETAKIAVRTALWPLLLFARMSVAFGFWITFLIMAAAMLTFIELYRRLVLGRNVRGEL